MPFTICSVKQRFFWQLSTVSILQLWPTIQRKRWPLETLRAIHFGKLSSLSNASCFPALRALRFCDVNKLAMDKIFYLCDWAQNFLLRSSSLLSNHSLFGFLEMEFTEGVEEELEEVFGCTKDDINEK